MKRIIIKVGTSTLTQGTQTLSRRFMLGLAQQIVELHQRGIQCILVSSGAVATGRGLLHAQISDRSLLSKQLCASIGQVKLMQVWSEVFDLLELRVAQVLLTKEDFSEIKIRLAKETIEGLLRHNIIPIINENDAVATQEVGIGDNDNLAALLAQAIEADTVILLTDQEGLYTANPRLDPDAKLISLVEQIDPSIRAIAGESSSLGTGGMATKIAAAHRASQSGIRTIIASAAHHNVLIELAHGASIGTLFLEEKLK